MAMQNVDSRASTGGKIQSELAHVDDELTSRGGHAADDEQKASKLFDLAP